MGKNKIDLERLSIEIYGGSHDEKIGIKVSGLPFGDKVDINELERFLSRRAPGSSYGTQRKEADKPVFLSGIDENNRLDGSLLEAVIYNKDTRSADYSSAADIPRPSHADYPAIVKYNGNVDLRGGGRFSGRLTALLCIAGGICLQLLKKQGIIIGAHISQLGDVADDRYDSVNLSSEQLLQAGELRSPASERSFPAGKFCFPAIDTASAAAMIELLERTRADGDSIGAVVECGAIGLPVGLGEHMFHGLEGNISRLVFCIPGVKGIEFGAGFSLAGMLGSEANDPYYTDGAKIYTRTNNSGGIAGGMSTGMPLIFRAVMKPTPSIAKEQDSVSLSRLENVKLNIVGRHDPCIAVRAVPVFEAVTAIALLDLINY